MNEKFSIESNPFFLLQVTYQSSRTEISVAVEDAILDRGIDESVLADAQQKLVSPNQRIAAEISYLPELSPAQVTIICDGIEGGNLQSKWVEVSRFPEIARANVFAHVAAKGNADVTLISALFDAWAEFEPDDVFEFLAVNRRLAGFPPPDRYAFQGAVTDLNKMHAAAGAYGIVQSENPSALLSEIVETYKDSECAAGLLGEMVHQYDRATEVKLTRIGDALEACAIAIEADPKAASKHASMVPDLLDEWDDVNQPVQLYEQARGHEEGRSRKISNRLRNVSISLANDHGDYASASVISKALLHTFPELESVAAQLQGDVSELEKLAEKQKLEEEMKGLLNAFEVAKKNVKGLSQVLKHGVSLAAPSPLGRFVEEFVRIHTREEYAEMSWNLVRVLALLLNNEASNPWASWAFLDGMMSKYGRSLSSRLKGQLTEDKNTAFKNWKFEELQNTTGAGKSIKLIDEMLPFASGDEAKQLRDLRGRLSGRQVWGWIKTSAVLAFLGFVFGPIIIDEINTKPQRAYTPTSTTRTTTSSKPDSVNSGVTSATSAATATETQPLAGLSRALTRPELRYCLYQGERMDNLRPLLDNYDNNQIDRFNALIEDLNLRCGNYRYYENDMVAVRRELEGKASEFLSGAYRIIGSW